VPAKVFLKVSPDMAVLFSQPVSFVLRRREMAQGMPVFKWLAVNRWSVLATFCVWQASLFPLLMKRNCEGRRGTVKVGNLFHQNDLVLMHMYLVVFSSTRCLCLVCLFFFFVLPFTCQSSVAVQTN